MSLQSLDWDVSDDTRLVRAIHGSLYIDTEKQEDIDWNAISRRFANKSALACKSRYMLIKQDDQRQDTLQTLENYQMQLLELEQSNKERLRKAPLKWDAPNLAMGSKNEPKGGSADLKDYQMQMMRLEQQNKKRLLMARQAQDSLFAASGSSPEKQRAQTHLPPSAESTERVRDTTQHISSLTLSPDENIRNHPEYQDAAPEVDGLYHCPYEESCNHKPMKLRSAYVYV
jgi:hypothetical protein